MIRQFIFSIIVGADAGLALIANAKKRDSRLSLIQFIL